MIFRRYGRFTGGIALPDEKRATLDLPIRPCPPMERLAIPLAPCGGKPARLLVQPPAAVEAGQKIAAPDDEDGAPVFAPLSGRITGLTTVRVAGEAGFAPSPAAELTALGKPGTIRPMTPVFPWREADPEALIRRIAEGGLTTHRARPVPLVRWVRAARQKRARTLIANGMEQQPYVTADHRLLTEHGTGIIRGLAILGRATGIDDMVLAVDHRRTDDYRKLVETAGSYGVTRIALSSKYPTGNDTMLVKVLCRREVPPGGGPIDVGAAVIDVATCFAVYRWVACGAPPTARVVTVSGERTASPGNLWVPFGARCRELAGPADPPIIHGGPMSGLRCPPDAVVTPATDAVLAIDTPPFAAATPCIRCGWCTDHCPARLNVAALNDAFELGELDRSERLGAPACVACGVCTYVCPARLPLSQRVKRMKRLISASRSGPGRPAGRPEPPEA
ncbi:MAG TPA: RnfABCDGE type electron transport complex subunit C [Phycisphaerae bacterium]|nr:RnfABCDGE type electron transport complex subunit C [Phycisphaerae bacterium]